MCLEQETWALLPTTRHTRLTGPTMPRGPPGSVRGASLGAFSPLSWNCGFREQSSESESWNEH